MNQHGMILLARRRIDDRRHTRWSDEEIVFELNRAAVFMGTLLNLYATDHQLISTATITTDGSAKEFICSFDDGLGDEFSGHNYFKRVYRAIRTDTSQDEPTKQVKAFNETRWSYSSGFDDRNRLVWWLRYDVDIPNNEKDVYVVFPVVHASGVVMKLEAITNIPVFGNDEGIVQDISQSYPGLPNYHHEFLVQRAVINLLNSDDTLMPGAQSIYLELKNNFVLDQSVGDGVVQEATQPDDDLFFHNW